MNGNTSAGRSAPTNIHVKPGGLCILRNMDQQRQRENYPDIRPELLPPPKYSDKTANGLTRCIIKFLQLSGHQAERIAVTGRQIDQRVTFTDVLGHTRQIGSVKWIRGSMQPGTADISATIHGRSVKVEVKVKRDRQRKDQARYQQQVEAAGGIYVIASSFEGFYQWYITTFKE